jgi:hypothetical protein
MYNFGTFQAIRDICDTYTDRGLPNYPSGVPFTFWEQYINLRFYLALSILCILMVTFVVLTLVLLNPWLASIVVSPTPFRQLRQIPVLSGTLHLARYNRPR